jgi:hypothetical protein
MENSSAIALLLYPEAIQASISFSLNVKRDKAGCVDESPKDFGPIRHLVNAFLEYQKSPFNTAQMPLAIRFRGSLL